MDCNLLPTSSKGWRLRKKNVRHVLHKHEGSNKADDDDLLVIDKNQKQKTIVDQQNVVKELERRIGQGNRRLSGLLDLRSLHEYNLHPQHGPDGPDRPYRP